MNVRFQDFHAIQALTPNDRSMVRTGHPSNLLRYLPLNGRNNPELPFPDTWQATRLLQSLPLSLFGNFPTHCTARAGTYSCTSGLTSCAPTHRVARGSACRTPCRATNNGSLLSITLGGNRRTRGTTDGAANYSAGIST